MDGHERGCVPWVSIGPAVHSGARVSLLQWGDGRPCAASPGCHCAVQVSCAYAGVSLRRTSFPCVCWGVTAPYKFPCVCWGVTAPYKFHVRMLGCHCAVQASRACNGRVVLAAVLLPPLLAAAVLFFFFLLLLSWCSLALQFNDISAHTPRSCGPCCGAPIHHIQPP
jgi:hypothetical protein